MRQQVLGPRHICASTSNPHARGGGACPLVPAPGGRPAQAGPLKPPTRGQVGAAGLDASVRVRLPALAAAGTMAGGTARRPVAAAGQLRRQQQRRFPAGGRLSPHCSGWRHCVQRPARSAGPAT
jgi:hypothetical protein